MDSLQSVCMRNKACTEKDIKVFLKIVKILFGKWQGVLSAHANNLPLPISPKTLDWEKFDTRDHPLISGFPSLVSTSSIKWFCLGFPSSQGSLVWKPKGRRLESSALVWTISTFYSLLHYLLSTIQNPLSRHEVVPDRLANLDRIIDVFFFCFIYL